MNKGHVPVRQCVACKTRAEKPRFMRFVQSPGGGWISDPTGREPGRGTYLCSPECAERVKKNKRYRALSSIATSAPWPPKSTISNVATDRQHNAATDLQVR